KNHAEPSIYYFSPTDTSAVVNTYPGCAAKTVSYYILNGHISSETGTIVNIGGFPVWRICSGYVMMVTSEYYFTYFSGSYCLIKCFCYFHSSLGIRIEYTCLRPYHEFVFLCSPYPPDIIGHLLLYFLRGITPYLFQYFTGNAIGTGKVFRFSAGTYPTEGP